jgi:hypothetical protein
MLAESRVPKPIFRQRFALTSARIEKQRCTPPETSRQIRGGWEGGGVGGGVGGGMGGEGWGWVGGGGGWGGGGE